MFAFLFNPFHKIAGYKALTIGGSIIALTAFFAFLFNTHFSGIIDIKYSSDLNLPYIVFLFQVLINILVVAILMYVASLFLSGSSVRFVDVAGTQALARTPFVIAPFLNAFGLIERGGSAMLSEYLNQEMRSPFHISNGVFLYFLFFLCCC